ncbi:PqqD family protein [Jatrophihabitans sp. DSM 45814]
MLPTSAQSDPTGAGSFPLHTADIDVQDLDDEVCLYRADIDEVLVLNGTAGDIWRLADGTASVAQIITLLAQAYQTSTAAIDADVVGVLTDLAERGFLEWTPSADPKLETTPEDVLSHGSRPSDQTNTLRP